jgi:nicotinate phosphoribosyltransferase
MTSVPGLPSALLVDLYELTMGESYLAEGIAERPATFQLACRTLPPGWGYLIAAGVEDALDYLEGVRFGPDELAYLETTRLFTPPFLERLAAFRFNGDVRALPEGTAFFPHEPVLELTAPLLEAQLVETALLNTIQYPTLIASKAARCVEAAGGRRLVEFGLRRAHGGEAGLKAARASYLAGFDATSNLQAGAAYGIPVAGTMAHSYVECFAGETDAFEAFTRSYPDGSTLLIDTYDTIEGARRAAAVALELAGFRPEVELRRGPARSPAADPALPSVPRGRLGAVRIDSGDLAELSRAVRGVLDGAGLPEVAIFASGNLDEHEIARLVEAGAPVDGFGVGTRLGTSAGAPYLEVAYKLVSFDGRPVLKLSPGKATLPGGKQVWRRSAGGVFAGDVVELAAEPGPAGAEALLEPALLGGGRTGRVTLDEARARAAAQRAALPPALRGLEAGAYPVEIGAGLAALDARVRSELLGRT